MVGAGPAGVSAALWARSLGLDVEVLEGEASVGGQLQHIHFQPLNVPGAPEGHGPAIAARLARQLGDAKIPMRLRTTAARFEASAGETALHVASGERLVASAFLVATGVRRRRLEVPGDRELEGRGVSYSASQDRNRFAGEDVVVVGGGDAAFENALLLADVGCRVTLVARGEPRARPEFLARVSAHPDIQLWERSRVLAIEGEDRVRRIHVDREGSSTAIEARGVVIKIGVLPNSEWCRDAVSADEDGYLKIDASCATSAPRVWAAGDVTRPTLFGVAVSAGQGALAVASIRAALRR